MGKVSKEYEERMSGMIYAMQIAKRDGIEALEKEIRMRGITRIPVNVKTEKVKELWRETCENLYCNVITCALYTLHEEFGFGHKRLEDFKKKYDGQIKNAIDLDYLGEHYVKIADYARWLNEQYDFGIDTDRLEYTQSNYDRKDENYHICKVERVIDVLKMHDQEEAAELIANCIEEMKDE